MKVDKKLIYETERHISILSAPNYNLNIILKEILTGFKTEGTIVSEFDIHKSDSFNPSTSDLSQVRHSSVSSIKDSKKTVKPDKLDYKSIMLNGPQSLSDYGAISMKNKINNFSKIKRVLDKDKLKLKKLIESTNELNEELVKKCTITAQEKIELIEETEQLEVNMNELIKQRNELNNRSSNRDNSSSIPNFETSPLQTNTSTKDSKGSREQTNTLPSNPGLSKQKKIQELRSTLAMLEKSLEEAKVKAKEKAAKDKIVKAENKELQSAIEQKTTILNQYKAEIAFMKKQLESVKKETKEPASNKLFGAIKSIFKKKGS